MAANGRGPPVAEHILIQATDHGLFVSACPRLPATSTWKGTQHGYRKEPTGSKDRG
jgi:hypothetical protein